MIQFTGLFVVPIYPDELSVTWVVTNPLEAKNYLFDIYISDDPDGLSYEKVNTIPIVNEYSYQFRTPIMSKHEYFYVFVEATEDGSSTKKVTYSAKLPIYNYFNAREIVRKKDLLRKKFTGVQVKVRKKKILGEQCQVCIDDSTGYVTNSRCPVCYGTRIVDGYLSPIGSFCEISESAIAVTTSEVGTLENMMAVGGMTLPLVFEGDIVIENDRNKRWLVHSVKRTQLQTFPVDQRIELRQLSPKDVEYTL